MPIIQNGQSLSERVRDRLIDNVTISQLWALVA